MKNKRSVLKLCIALLLFFAFSMLFIGCGENGGSKVQTERVETKQPAENNSLDANEIHLDEWRQLVKDIKSTLGDMDEIRERAEQVSKPR